MIYKVMDTYQEFVLISCLQLNHLLDAMYNGNISYSRDRVNVMVFNVTFNNISVISWRSVLLVEETGVPGENH